MRIRIETNIPTTFINFAFVLYHMLRSTLDKKPDEFE